MKYSVNFIPEKCKSQPEEGNLRMVIQWSGGGRVTMAVGHKVVLAKWSKDAQRCKNGTMHGSYPAARINRDIQRYEDVANEVMLGFDDAPDNAVVKEALLGKLRKTEEVKAESMLFDFDTFISEQSVAHNWADGTIKTFRATKKRLLDLFPQLEYKDILTGVAQEKIIAKFQDIGLKSSTIHIYISHINWFLRWAEKTGRVKKAPNYVAHVKAVPRRVIYLNQDELMTVYNSHPLNFALQRVRDLFCFCCFTGLRFSDAISLKGYNIKDDCIRLVSKKDTEDLTIELNKYSRAILERAPITLEERMAGYVLPHYTNIGAYNIQLRNLAKYCGIDEAIHIVFYRGGQRVEETKPKYDLISSHTGRKTFICTALSHGVSPNIVMKWTGHSSYDAMKPYIDVTSQAKKTAMSVFDDLERYKNEESV